MGVSFQKSLAAAHHHDRWCYGQFFLGLLIFAGMIYYWGETYIKPDDVKYGMVVDSLGMELGLQDGDKIVSAGGVPVVKFNAGVVAKEIIINEAKEIIVDRKGQQVTLNVPPTLVAELTKYENKGKSLFYPRIPMNIMEVSPDGPAEKSGLKQGMNIIAVNGKPIAFQHEFRKALQDFKGKNTDFTVITATSDTLTKQIAVSDEGKIGIAMEQLHSIFGEIWSFGIHF